MSMERADAKSEGAEGVDRGNSSSRAGEAAHWLGAALQARLWPPGRAHPSSRSPPPQAGAQEVSGRRGSGCPRPGPRRRARSSSQTHVERLRGPEGEGAGGGAARAGAGLRRGRGSALSPRAELTGGGGAPERGRGSSRHLCSRLQVGGRGSEERGRDLERRGGACPAGGRGRRGCRTGGAAPRSLSPPPAPIGGPLTSRSRRCWTCTATTVAAESSAETASTARDRRDIAAGGTGGACRSRPLAAGGRAGRQEPGGEEARPAASRVHRARPEQRIAEAGRGRATARHPGWAGKAGAAGGGAAAEAAAPAARPARGAAPAVPRLS